MSKEDKRICKMCKKEYDFEVEQTVSFLNDGVGMEFVVCEKCFDKYQKIILNGVKR
jgi:hypothetical protein